MNTKNLLLELGTEELPPKSLRKLAQALHDNFIKLLNKHELGYKTSKWYATPRRLALYISELDVKQKDQLVTVKGPSLKAAYTPAGEPTKAALGWATANHISLDQSQILKTDKGAWLYYTKSVIGTDTANLLPKMFSLALKNLPIPKLMHWGSKKFEFVRPVHTLCLLFGEDLIPASLFGIESSRIINGHRFIGPKQISIDSADSYVTQLASACHVIVDYEQRKALIISQIKMVADSVNGVADLDDTLVEEVCSIVESPHIFKAHFDESFLAVPPEALVYTMKGDQKYFPIYSHDRVLTSTFAFASNINPADPSQLIAGNERVIRPRLADAQFFFNTDRKHPLEFYFNHLNDIVYQKDIGSLAFRSELVGLLSSYIANLVGADPLKASRAAHLAKCDLASTMVTEFPDTQGIMGMHYAALDGEDPDVADAILQQYHPRFAGDSVPVKPVQISLSLADKLMTLSCIFGINMLPKGDKDPFGLRRAAIGLIRIILENKLELDICALVKKSCALLGSKIKLATAPDLIVEFIFNRLKAFYQDQGIETSIFAAVLSVKPVSILDFDKRVHAVKSFKALPESSNLALAYKRINNILSHADASSTHVVPDLLLEKPEQDLMAAITRIQPQIEQFYARGDYQHALCQLATLKDPVDLFFDKILVNAKDDRLRLNRFAILLNLRTLISNTADISVLY